MKSVELKNINKKFKNNSDFAIKAVSFEVEKGEIMALLGPSGCGKTTILRMIAGLETPDDGEIHINSKDVFTKKHNISPDKRSVGMVFQDFALFPHLTVKKNIMFGVTEKNKKFREEIYANITELISLKGFGDRYPHELSGGQQQRVALGRALAVDPEVILFDEPFSSLDSNLKEDMRMELSKIIKASGKAAILVTHDVEDAIAVADKAILVVDGEIKEKGTPLEIIASEEAISHMQFLKGIGTMNIGKTSTCDLRAMGVDIKCCMEDSHLENSCLLFKVLKKGA